MTTKTDGISSGLVAVAYIDTSNDMGDRLKWKVEFDDDQPLVRLSDAEAIINDLQTLVIAENQRKQQLEQEVAQMKSDLDEEAHIRDRMAQLLAETAVALKGPEKALHRHGWQDLPDVAAKQSAALKLAKDAFSAINIEAKTFMSYENARNNFSDDTDERKAYERAMVKASELTKQALAAIDNALGEAE